MRSVLAVAALVALVSAGCGGGTAAPETLPADVAVTTESAGAQAPPIDGVTLAGERLALADLRGRAVFVNVWASW